MNNVGQLIGLIAQGKGAKFANIKYRNAQGELARHTLILGASTVKLYEKDIAKLEAMLAGDMEPMARAAAEKVLASRRQSLEKGIGNNDAYTHGPAQGDTYVHVDSIPGVKIHKDTGVVYVMALTENKVVLEPGTPKKPVNSKPETLAKKAIEAMLPSARLRQFTLSHVARAAMNGEVLEVDAE